MSEVLGGLKASYPKALIHSCKRLGRLKRLQSPKTRYRPDVILTDVRLERAASVGVVVTSKGGRQVSRF